MRRALPWLLLLALAPLAHGDEQAVFLPTVPGTEHDVEWGEDAVESVLVLEEVAPGRLAPVAGARVRCFTEDVRGVSLGAQLVAEAATDANGVAILAAAAGSGEHWLVDAPGFAVRHEYCGFGFLDDVVVLERGQECTIRVLDPFGEPLAGARVEVLLGCPHSPAGREGVTDAEGLVTLGPVDDEGYDLWISARGVRPDDVWLPASPTDGSVAVVLTRPGRTARGVVLDADGAPVAGATVRELDRMRGPKTATDAEGRFVLHGCTGEGEIAVFLPTPPYDETPALLVEAFADDVPLRLVLDPERPTALGEGQPHHRLDVVLENAGSLTSIEVVRLADGFTARARANLWTNAFSVPPGHYRVSAGGGFAFNAPVSVETHVPTPDGKPVKLDLEAQSASFGVLVPPEARGWTAELRIEGAAKSIDLSSPYAWIPPEGRAALVVWSPRPLVFAVPESDGVRKPSLDLPAPTRVQFRVLDEAGRPLEAEIDTEHVEGEVTSRGGGRYELITREAGEVELGICAEGLEPHDLGVVLPDASVDLTLPDVVLRAEVEPVERLYRVLDDDGVPVAEPWIDLGVFSGGEDVDAGDEPGTLRLTLLRPPRVGVVKADGFFPMPVTLEREGSTTLRFPAGRIEVVVTDDAGAPLDPLAWVDGHAFEGKEGRVQIQGVPAGPHRLLVGVPGHGGVARRLTMQEGEQKVLVVALPAR